MSRPLAAVALAALFAAAPAIADPLEVTTYEIQAERDLPEACFVLSLPLDRPSGTDYRPFVQVTPAADIAVHARGLRLCVEGLEHGQSYEITLRQGLPAAGGALLEAAERFTLAVPDRAPSARFRGQGQVLPSAGAEGLPLVTVNVERVQVNVLRIGDRGLIQQLRDGMISQALTRWSRDWIAEQQGEPVFSGELQVRAERNRPVTTAIPIAEAIGPLRPGVYVASAAIPTDGAETWRPEATQWFVVADIGLVTFQAANGLFVATRSLAGAAPLEGIELALLARNNEELGRAVTDADGLARFDPGLLRGQGGNSPEALFAYGADGEFVFLQLSGPGLDLSDRGVGGREPPGPLDAFLWSERGIYRPGESVHLGVLLRDDSARAADGLPLTLKVQRPDGAEVERLVITPAAAGGYTHTLPLSPAALTGAWTITAHLDADAPARHAPLVKQRDDLVARHAGEARVTSHVVEPGIVHRAALPDVVGKHARFAAGRRQQ